MIRILIYLLVGGYLLYKVQQFLSKKQTAETLSSPQNDSEEEVMEDPICHTFVTPQDAYREIIDGQEMFFCSQECAKKFKSQHIN